ncbi:MULTISPECIES: DUF2656 family protein [Synechococcaceae]|uniref:DUF2656 family protein n=1 Tax=Synechococcaceae TaxID=1890426 RepID=UPI0008FF0581|nr:MULTISPECIES: DUF2656 family protein [Synechococcaceae]MCT4365886.1 DUF2656 domain-containing protein [Candidatus Regnicoccus frigidus MAG-AL1]APD48345.1 hypothetical protein BM449_08940 [Synechococcus sp. SynAce01]MCT0244831.1 DUF2656 domain-containing protein [Synechococcus sp. CS-601]MCT4366675.1 DUF2656 domain-containing protein [Candidatus Regnicoccus frigidus MAG-AL2]TWB92283.1 uncharacterized protein DUF2656 [Synechococcus sp. Ace-Pa]
MATDTSFVISHNFQLPSESYADLRGSALVELLTDGLDTGITTGAANGIAIKELVHPHWRAKVTAPLEPIALARLLGQTLRNQRVRAGESDAYTVLLLGGRKDQPGQLGSPLQLGGWGVDLVETNSPEAFLKGISWEALKGARPIDAVFEIWEPQCQ